MPTWVFQQCAWRGPASLAVIHYGKTSIIIYRMPSGRLELEDRFPASDILQRPIEPDSIVQRKLSLHMDDGAVVFLRAYCVQHSNELGIYKGGLRWMPQ